MLERYLPILGKISGLLLLFNSILTITYGITVFFLFKWFFPSGNELYPYLLSGYIFLVIAVLGMLNILPSALVSRAFKTGRILFHHYVYGFFVLLAAYAYLAIIHFNIPMAFLVFDTGSTINAARLLIIIGATLVIDDLPDVHPTFDYIIKKIKPKTEGTAKQLSIVHFLTAIVSSYAVAIICVGAWRIQLWYTFANWIVIVNIAISAAVAFASLKMNGCFRLQKTGQL